MMDNQAKLEIRNFKINQEAFLYQAYRNEGAI